MLRARDNPFSSDRILRERYRLDATGWERLLDRLRAQRNRGALVGPHGSGKTTLLEDLGARLSAQGHQIRWLRISTERPRLPDEFRSGCRDRAFENEFVLLDGAEQLGPISWWQFCYACRNAFGVVVTTHRPGRLKSLHTCRTHPALLHEIVASLGEQLTPNEAEALYGRHRGNLREALRELYDRAAASDRGVTRS